MILHGKAHNKRRETVVGLVFLIVAAVMLFALIVTVNPAALLELPI